MNQSLFSIKTIVFSIFILILFGVITLVLILSFPKYSTQTYEIIKDSSEYNVFGDRANSGNSIARKITQNNSTGFDCSIKQGYDYPYCITRLELINEINQGVDFSNYKQMIIYGTYTAPSKNDFLRVTILNFNPDYSLTAQAHTNKYNLVELQSLGLDFPIVIDLKEFKVPIWWASNMRKKNVTSETELDNVSYIEIGTGSEATLGMHNLRISKIEFTKDIITINQLYEYIIIFWASVLFIYIISIISYLIISLRKTKKSEQSLMAVNEMLSVKSAQLELISQHDELTGLLNRTGLKSKMIECVDQKLYPLSLVMIDVDFFKKINDTFGHQKGDVVLSHFGELLKDFVQNNESVSRFGGEEFIILMPQSSQDEVMQRIEGLRKLIESTDMEIDQSVTASFGMASSSKYSEFKKLIELADSALYKAKQEGRNCIRVATT